MVMYLKSFIVGIVAASIASLLSILGALLLPAAWSLYQDWSAGQRVGDLVFGILDVGPLLIVTPVAFAAAFSRNVRRLSRQRPDPATDCASAQSR